MKSERDEARQRILDAAREEFLLSGYARASMRTIAAQAGMTVGNIYLYFTGKAQLFDALVNEPMELLRRMVRLPSLTEESIRELVTVIHGVFIRYRVEFLILLMRSDGSRHERFKETVIDIAVNRMIEQLAGVEDERFFRPFAVALVEGLLEIFKQFNGDAYALLADIGRFLHYMLGGLTAARQAKEGPCEA